jgi:hypothetical protein
MSIKHLFGSKPPNRTTDVRSSDHVPSGSESIAIEPHVNSPFQTAVNGPTTDPWGKPTDPRGKPTDPWGKPTDPWGKPTDP